MASTEATLALCLHRRLAGILVTSQCTWDTRPLSRYQRHGRPSTWAGETTSSPLDPGPLLIPIAVSLTTLACPSAMEEEICHHKVCTIVHMGVGVGRRLRKSIKTSWLHDLGCWPGTEDLARRVYAAFSHPSLEVMVQWKCFTKTCCVEPLAMSSAPWSEPRLLT